MSRTVRCPSCDTRFQASAEQLRAAGGWVRCGRCGQGFDAATQVAATSIPIPTPPTMHLNAHAPLLRRVSDDTQAGPAATYVDRSPPHEPRTWHVAHDRRSVERSPAQPPAQSPWSAATPARRAVDTTTPDFLREDGTTQPAFGGNSSAERSSGWLLGIALVGVLLAQLLLQHRDELAARAPSAAPLLAQACALLGCAIAAPREIDALSISNSSLTRTATGGYRLALGVKSRSDLRLAMPGIELTLLDPSERMVVRRVLMARDLGADAALAPYSEWAGAIRFDLPDKNDRITDYRVLAFYP